MSTTDLAARAATLARTLLGTDATLVRNPGSTVSPPRTLGRGRRALEVLRGLTDANALVEEGVLGQGGMGVVTLARQVALDRLVAVKSLKPGEAAQDEVEALLSEAWLTGALEHPNILPLHGLSLRADGRPALVMKRIEGRTWSRLLTDAEALAAVAPGQQPLEAHVRLLIQVCNALHFAHARGVVHRDVKPDNVMVGTFGEVYLVDWGIATEPGPATQLAGTPAYMAPEMVGEGAPLTPRTDVYLLGAVLFEVLAGHPPHTGASLTDVLASVLRSTPELPAAAPGELAELVRRCMAAQPEARPATALEVRLALEAFLEHQGSRALALESQARLGELVELLRADVVDGGRVAALFSACRFGFQQALRGWPENPDARAGLQRALELMVRHEVRHGTARAAEALLAELPTPAPALAGEVAEARRREQERELEVQRLEELARRHDPTVGERRRLVSAMGLAAMWVTGPLVGHFIYEPLGAFESLIAFPVSVLSILALLVLKRVAPPEDRTHANIQVSHLLLFVMSMQAVGHVGLYAAGVELGPLMVPLLLGYWGFAAGIIAVAIDARVFGSLAGYWGCMLLAVAWPQWRYLFGALGNLAVLTNLFVMLRHPRKAPAN